MTSVNFPEQLKPLEEPLLIQYLPNAEFQMWLQRISRTVILCMVSCVMLMMACQAVPALSDLLYAFFKWLLIPVKPLLMAKPTAAMSGIVTMLTAASQIGNLVVFPAVAYLAFRAGALGEYLYLEGDTLFHLKQLGSSSSYDSSCKGIDNHVYQVLHQVPLTAVRAITVDRPSGKKSHGDYVLKMLGGAGKKKNEFSFRWGDLINPSQRHHLLSALEDRFPQDIDLSILEPFRAIPQRQSYTEIWLRELSGAPKRDKLTPLHESSHLAEGKYTVLRKVGVGGQATVYLATSTVHPDKDVVVLKEFVLPVYPDLRVRKKAAERFQAEATMLGKLQHPQIAKFLDLFVEDHRAYLVLEHIEGKSLKQLVASEGPLPEKEVRSIALQLCEILKYLHTQSPPVVHRDISPDNIMYGSDGLARLIDFSVAQESSSGVTGSVVGKPNYISPEQFRGKPTTQSDIYSFGATLFYLLIGHDPPPISILHPRAEKENVGDRFDAIIARCTQLETAKRYENVDAVLADLQGTTDE